MKLKVFLLLCFFSVSIHAANLEYQLSPREIATDTYLLLGKTEDFAVNNGGNIINTAFIITSAGVLVIDTGVSKLYGEQLRAAIQKITDKPIVKVLHTNSHPDRFLGNQAFQDVPRAALAKTREVMQAEASALTDNLYRMVGKWMQGTEPILPSETAKTGEWQLGNHQFELFEFHGHTQADLVILDKTTGVLWTGGLVFYQRMPTTPHAVLKDWLNTLNELEKIHFKTLVPSHGEITHDKSAIEQTRSYLQWLENTLTVAAQQGKTLIEVMQTPLPATFANFGVGHSEFERSAVHLFPALELAELK